MSISKIENYLFHKRYSIILYIGELPNCPQQSILELFGNGNITNALIGKFPEVCENLVQSVDKEKSILSALDVYPTLKNTEAVSQNN
jgi:hypothetical protein